MKVLLTTTALVAFAAMPAMAQQAATTETEMSTGAFMTSGDEMQISADATASNLIGKRIYTSSAPVSEEDGVMEISEEWEDIGEVGDILLSRDGSVQGIVLDIGGFLGIGERHVALKMDQIQMVNDADSEGEFFLVANIDRATIESAPEFDTAAIAQWAGATEQAAGNAAMETEQAVEGATEEVAAETQELSVETEQTAENAAADTEAAVEAAGEEVAQEANEAAVETEQMADAAGEQAEQTAEETAQMAENAAADTGAAVEAAGEEVAADTTEAAAETEQMAENAAADTEVAVEGTEEVAETADVTVTTEGTEATETAAATDGTAPMMPNVQREGWSTMAAADLTTGDLEGARLYDVNDELIGEVSQLIIDDNGQITQAVLDVGGFLGIGEKSVALPMDELQIQTANEGGEVRVYVNATEADLEAMEAYQEEG